MCPSGMVVPSGMVCSPAGVDGAAESAAGGSAGLAGGSIGLAGGSAAGVLPPQAIMRADVTTTPPTKRAVTFRDMLFTFFLLSWTSRQKFLDDSGVEAGGTGTSERRIRIPASSTSCFTVTADQFHPTQTDFGSAVASFSAKACSASVQFPPEYSMTASTTVRRNATE